jgi:hypothetical protein
VNKFMVSKAEMRQGKQVYGTEVHQGEQVYG